MPELFNNQNIELVEKTNVIPKHLVLYKIDNTNLGIHFDFVVDAQTDIRIALDISELNSYYEATQVMEHLVNCIHMLRSYNQHVTVYMCKEHYERYQYKEFFRSAGVV